ncbi:hypothetical protein [Kitasatospora herbaricolor]|uniref:Uncharacterized protein n=1 Tax=Kitasatospora herbaricolor TaxID=68217 RepID=A0ABZ1WMJ5_9ACTN|nr:hypothetical protein [Kitasatospora herbaricolor]
MTTDTTPTSPTAPPVHAPFARPERRFRQDSVLDGESDWVLARLALDRRSFAIYDDDPRAEEARRLAEEFTVEEAERVDRFLAAGVQDNGRLEAVAAAGPTITDEDRTWLLDQLRLAWQRLDRLRGCIDNSGSMMQTTYVASAVDYVRWSRRPEALTGLRPRAGA